MATEKQTDGRISLGQWGEERAAAWLETRGYRLIERNWRCRFGEIDLIAWSPENTLCFVEVRTSRGAAHGGAVASLHRRKRKRMADLALIYMSDRKLQVDARCDLIANQRVNGEWTLTHIINAFGEGGKQ